MRELGNEHRRGHLRETVSEANKDTADQEGYKVCQSHEEFR